jgi:hypothetical protein
VCRVRVQERDLQTEESAPRLGVDQLGALHRQLDKRGAEIQYFVRNVVHARAALDKELPDRCVGAERSEQLDAAFAHSQQRSLDTLIPHCFAVLEPRTEEALVRRQCLVEILDGDAEVVDPPSLHGSMLPEGLVA